MARVKLKERERVNGQPFERQTPCSVAENGPARGREQPGRDTMTGAGEARKRYSYEVLGSLKAFDVLRADSLLIRLLCICMHYGKLRYLRIVRS